MGGRSGEIYGRQMGLGEKEAQVGQIGKQSTMFRRGRLSKKKERKEGVVCFLDRENGGGGIGEGGFE